MSRTRISVVIALTSLACAAPAHAEFSPPVQVAEKGSGPEIFPRSDGGGVVTWRDKLGITAAGYTSALEVGGPAKLTDDATNVPVLAAATTGDLIAADRADLPGGETRIHISHLDPAGNVSKFEIGSPDVAVDSPAVAFARQPTGVLAYEQGTRDLRQGKVRLARLSRAGEPGATVTVGPGGLPQLALRSNGEAALAWSHNDGHAVTTVDGDNDVGAIEKLPERRRQYIADVAWGEAPRAAALLVGAAPSGSGGVIRLVRFGGAPRSAETLRVASARKIADPELAVDGRGHTWIGWRERNVRGLEVHARRLSRSGKLGAELTLSRGGGATESHLAAAPEGAGIVWRSEGDDAQVIRFAALTPQGRAGRAETILRTETQSLHGPAAAFDEAGRALVAYRLQGGGEGGLFLTRESG